MVTHDGIGIVNGFVVDLDRETDGRWIAEVRGVPGALAYGETAGEAADAAVAIAESIRASSEESR